MNPGDDAHERTQGLGGIAGRTQSVLALVGPLLLMFLLAWTPGTSMNEDLGRHLLLGRIISQTHAVPRTNLLTYTYPDYPFINHHWLSEVVFFQLHRAIGLNGLIVVKMLMMTASLALAMVTLRPRRGIALYWILGLLAAVALGYRSHIRPELFTYLGIAFYLWSFERIRRGARWPRWAILGYAVVWANAHIYFLSGLCMCAAFVLERWLDGRRSGKGSLRHNALWLGALVLASGINPNGLAGLLYPFHIMSDLGYDVAEMQSPFGWWKTLVNPMLLALPWLSGLTLAAMIGGLRRRKARTADLLIALAALAAAWQMVRNAPLLALAAPPVLGAWLSGPLPLPPRVRRADPRRAPRFPMLRARALAWGAPAAALLLNLWLVSAVWGGSYHRVFPAPVGPPPFGFDDETKYLALQDLQKDGLEGPIFSNFNIGSLVEYNLYPERAYVDNRPEAFPASFWRDEYRPAFALDQRWEQTCRRRKINAIIVSFAGVTDRYTREIMRRPEWVLVHVDGLLGVWVRDLPENQALIQARRIDAARLDELDRAIGARIDRLGGEPPWKRQVEAREALYDLYALCCIGETKRIWPNLWRLYNLYPDYEMTQELMETGVPPNRVGEVKALMARSARWPVADRQVLSWGRTLESQGDFTAARQVYARGRWFFPLSPELSAAESHLGEAR